MHARWIARWLTRRGSAAALGSVNCSAKKLEEFGVASCMAGTGRSIGGFKHRAWLRVPFESAWRCGCPDMNSARFRSRSRSDQVQRQYLHHEPNEQLQPTPNCNAANRGWALSRARLSCGVRLGDIQCQEARKSSESRAEKLTQVAASEASSTVHGVGAGVESAWAGVRPDVNSARFRSSFEQ